MEATAVEHGHAVRQPSRLAEEVGAQHDRAPVLRGEGADEVDDVAGGIGIEARRRLVEEQHVGVVEQRARQREALALTGREALHPVVGAVGHAEPLEQLAVAFVRRVGLVQPADPARDDEVLPRGEPIVEARVSR